MNVVLKRLCCLFADLRSLSEHSLSDPKSFFPSLLTLECPGDSIPFSLGLSQGLLWTWLISSVNSAGDFCMATGIFSAAGNCIPITAASVCRLSKGFACNGFVVTFKKFLFALLCSTQWPADCLYINSKL